MEALDGRSSAALAGRPSRARRGSRQSPRTVRAARLRRPLAAESRAPPPSARQARRVGGGIFESLREDDRREPHRDHGDAEQRGGRSTSAGASRPPPRPSPAATTVSAEAVSASGGSNGGSGGAARRRACRTAWASARTASSGVVKRGTALPVSAPTAGRVRLTRRAPAGPRRPPRRRCRGRPRPPCRQRPHEDRHDGVDRVVGEQDAQRPLVLIRGRRRDHVHRVRGRRLRPATLRPARARVAAESGSTRSPAASHASRRPRGPPALVSTATRSPGGSGWRASSPATSNISPTVSARSTPACANSASTVTSAAASSAPVRDDAARRPAARPS